MGHCNSCVLVELICIKAAEIVKYIFRSFLFNYINELNLIESILTSIAVVCDISFICIFLKFNYTRKETWERRLTCGNIIVYISLHVNLHAVGFEDLAALEILLENLSFFESLLQKLFG